MRIKEITRPILDSVEASVNLISFHGISMYTVYNTLNTARADISFEVGFEGPGHTESKNYNRSAY